MYKRHISAFFGGFVSTLIFHQGLIAILYHFGVIPLEAYNMSPVAPLGVPSVVSTAFFGGLWGIIIWNFVKTDSTKSAIIKCIIYGAIGPTAIAFLVVFPLKEISAPLIFIPVGAFLNGVWGLGLWAWCWALSERGRS